MTYQTQTAARRRGWAHLSQEAAMSQALHNRDTHMTGDLDELRTLARHIRIDGLGEQLKDLLGQIDGARLGRFRRSCPSWLSSHTPSSRRCALRGRGAVPEI